MEDTQEKTTATAPPVTNSGGIMDIQAPKPTPNNDSGQTGSVEEQQANSEPTVEKPSSFAPSPSADAPVTEEMPSEPAATPPTAPSSDESGAGTGINGANPSSPGADNPLAINQPPAAKKKSSAPVVAIAVAVIIAIALAVLVIFAYMKTKNDSKKTATQPAVTAAKVSPGDIDQASKDTDATLGKADDAKDFVVNDLADQTLGL